LIAAGVQAMEFYKIQKANTDDKCCHRTIYWLMKMVCDFSSAQDAMVYSWKDGDKLPIEYGKAASVKGIIEKTPELANLKVVDNDFKDLGLYWFFTTKFESKDEGSDGGYYLSLILPETEEDQETKTGKTAFHAVGLWTHEDEYCFFDPDVGVWKGTQFELVTLMLTKYGEAKVGGWVQVGEKQEKK
jgi:hypothetical protein